MAPWRFIFTIVGLVGPLASAASAASITPEFSTPGTSKLEPYIETAITYWESAITESWDLAVEFVAPGHGASTVSQAPFLGRNPSAAPKTTRARPRDDSDFSITLGVSHAGGANEGLDLFAPVLYEIEHALGFANETPLSNAVVQTRPGNRLSHSQQTRWE